LRTVGAVHPEGDLGQVIADLNRHPCSPRILLGRISTCAQPA
jgi:hypothetical protein